MNPDSWFILGAGGVAIVMFAVVGVVGWIESRPDYRKKSHDKY